MKINTLIFRRGPEKTAKIHPDRQTLNRNWHCKALMFSGFSASHQDRTRLPYPLNIGLRVMDFAQRRRLLRAEVIASECI